MRVYQHAGFHHLESLSTAAYFGVSVRELFASGADDASSAGSVIIQL